MRKQSLVQRKLSRKSTRADFIEEIKRLNGECKRKFGEFGLDLTGEPVSARQVRKFERELKIRLPEAYKRFVTELGNGGRCGSVYLYCLDGITDGMSAYAERLSKLPVMLDHSISNEEWVKFSQKYCELDEKFCTCTDTERDRILAEICAEQNEMESEMLAGGIVIGSPGCTMNYLLMCRGAACGEVFFYDFDYMERLTGEPACCGKFEDFIINILNKRLEGDL